MTIKEAVYPNIAIFPTENICAANTWLVSYVFVNTLQIFL
jgi:hypothetical protein